MKTIFTLFATLMMSIAVMAAPKDDARQQSMLTVLSADRGDIRVIIDGRRFEPNDNYLRIQSIDAGYHDVKVYVEKNTGLFTIFGKRYEVVFSKSIMIKPRTALTLQVDRFGSASVKETRMSRRYNGNGKDGRRIGTITMISVLNVVAISATTIMDTMAGRMMEIMAVDNDRRLEWFKQLQQGHE